MTTSGKIENPASNVVPPRDNFRLKTLVRKLRFYGGRYYCPLCNSNVRQLRPYGFRFPVLYEKQVIGGGYRSNARCPVCKSSERERLLYLYLTRRTDLFTRPVKLLHVAPEPGLSALFENRLEIDYLTADLNSDRVMVKMDITDIGYPDEHFDVIICNHVLEHIPEDRKAMGELYRVLKTGGFAVLQVPIGLALEETFEDLSVTDPQQREAVFGQSDHVRIYARDYSERLAGAGFRVEVFEWWDDPEFSEADNKYGLLAHESLYLAHR